MKHFFCPYCGKQLDSQNFQYNDDRKEQEFWCDDCHKIFICAEGDYVEEDAE